MTARPWSEWSGGAAQVLVTVYQDADGQHDAPKLQVIRLS